MNHHGRTVNGPPLDAEALLAGLLHAAQVDQLPARPWPLVAACQTLAARLSADSPYLGAVRQVARPRQGEKQAEQWLRLLVQRGAFWATGTGLSAAWVAEDSWLNAWPRIHEESADAQAWQQAGQALARSWSMWRKMCSAA